MAKDPGTLDPQLVRALLTEWARWLTHGSGYAHRSSCAVLQDGGGGSGGFHSRPPSGAMPGQTAERASIAMMRLRDCDPQAAAVLESWYLREGNPTAATLARDRGLVAGQYHALRKNAERKFGGLYGDLDGDG